jgi:hypothetical protein
MRAMSITLDLPEDVLQKLQQAAAERDVSLDALVTQRLSRTSGAEADATLPTRVSAPQDSVGDHAYREKLEAGRAAAKRIVGDRAALFDELDLSRDAMYDD